MREKLERKLDNYPVTLILVLIASCVLHYISDYT